jgi:hypothetical protein
MPSASLNPAPDPAERWGGLAASPSQAAGGVLVSFLDSKRYILQNLSRYSFLFYIK